MQLLVAVQKNQNQAQLFDLNSSDEVCHRIISWDSVKDNKPNAIFYDSSAGVSTLDQLIPVFPKSDYLEQSFDHYPSEQWMEVFLKASQRWVLHNNLKSIESLWEMTENLRSLWHQDRTSFFEQLWHWVHINFGTVDLKFVYHEMVESNKKNDRPYLVPTTIEGSILPNIKDGEEKEKAILEAYYHRESDNFDIETKQDSQNRWSAIGRVNKSPIIIMAQSPEIGPLQQSLAKGLFSSLQNIN